MAFASKPKSKSTKGNLPDNQLVIKVPTKKGYVTLGKVGLYNESKLHSLVANLEQEQLLKLIAKAELSIVPYESSTDEDIEVELEAV